MSQYNVLFILTSHSVMGDSGTSTGIWFEELSTPYYLFKDAGYAISIASVVGGAVPIDPHSQKALGENPPSVDRFLQDTVAMAALQNSSAINDVDATGYEAVFLPGGHGTMWDLPDNAPLAAIVTETLSDDRIVAAVCHGPAGLLGAVDKQGQPVIKGRKVSAFTNAEESAAGHTDTMPFLLETRLRELGAEVQTAPNFESFAVVDGKLITGQNPASSEIVAQHVINALGHAN